MALTDAKARAAKLPEGRKQMKLADGGGLYLRSPMRVVRCGTACRS